MADDIKAEIHLYNISTEVNDEDSTFARNYIQEKINSGNIEDFFGFDSIQRIDQAKFLGKLRKYDVAKQNWAISEKIHGANFSLTTDGKQVVCGRRNGYLDQDSSFYNFQKLLPELRPKILTLFEMIQKENKKVTMEGKEEFEFSNIKVVRVFGEIFGGLYNHKDVQKVPGVKYVQKEIQYSPNLHFYAFDVCVGEQFLSVKLAHDLLQKSEISFCKTIKTGPLDQLLEFDVESFRTTIPMEIGLPELERNVAEGIVLRPYDGYAHVLLKKKANAFEEKVEGNASASNEKKKPAAQNQVVGDLKANTLTRID